VIQLHEELHTLSLGRRPGQGLDHLRPVENAIAPMARLLDKNLRLYQPANGQIRGAESHPVVFHRSVDRQGLGCSASHWYIPQHRITANIAQKLQPFVMVSPVTLCAAFAVPML